MTFLFLSLLPLSGCEDMPWSRDGNASGTADTPLPAATYERRLLFLASGPELPAAATFDFTAVTDSAGLRREAAIRLATAEQWAELLDETWSTGPMRAPWRILPHGDLRVVVTDAGEIDALALEGESRLRVDTGERLAESSPTAGTQLILQDAVLITADSAYQGVLLDAQVGRPRDPTTAPAATSVEALLTHGSDYHAVVLRVAGGLVAWVNDDGESSIHRGVRLSRQPDDADPAAREGTTWLIEAAPELNGRLTTELADSTAGSAYALVSGWLEDGGVRLDVFGLVRQDR